MHLQKVELWGRHPEQMIVTNCSGDDPHPVHGGQSGMFYDYRGLTIL